MADPGPSARPRRSAAMEAQLKVEETYEIWGQPLSHKASRRATPARKRSTTAEASTARRRSQISKEHHNEEGSPTAAPKTEPENNTSDQPVKRRRGRPRKHPVPQQIPDDIQQESEPVSPGFPNSSALKDVLRQIETSEEDVGLVASSHIVGQERGVEDPTDDVIATSSTPATTPHSNAIAYAERLTQTETGSDSSFHDIQVPGILQDAPDVERSSLGAESSPVGSWEGATRVGAMQMEWEGVPSTPEGLTRGDNHDDRLWQVEANAIVQETQHHNASSSRAPTFNSEDTYFLSHSSSPDISPLPYSAGVRDMHDIITSTFRDDWQLTPLLGWDALISDLQAIQKLETRIEQEATPEEKAAMSAYLQDAMSVGLKKTLAQHGINPFHYYCRTRAVELYGRLKMTGMSSAAATSSGIRDWTKLPREYALRTLVGGDVTIASRVSPQNQHLEVLSSPTASTSASSSEAYRSAVLEEAFQDAAERAGPTFSNIDGRQRRLSFHPPPMDIQTPNIYLDRYPHGSSTGAHSFDPLVGLPDHSDPRTFHAADNNDKQHVLDALQATIDHFRQLTDGVDPGVIILDSGYEVAHTLLQADLHLWYVINRPDFAHQNAIPKLFKLDRWEGGIEHWKFASNLPGRTIAADPHDNHPPRPEKRSRAKGRTRKRVGTPDSVSPRDLSPSRTAAGTPNEDHVVQQNYPPCEACAQGVMYCSGFQKDIRNRCEACRRKGLQCSYDMAPFKEFIRI